MTPILVPREVAADDVVRVRAWLAADGARVAADAELAELATSKAVVVIHAPRAGYLAQSCREGDRLHVGDRLGAIHGAPVDSTAMPITGDRDATAGPGLVISRAARALMDRHGLDVGRFAGRTVIRERDVVGALVDDVGPATSGVGAEAEVGRTGATSANTAAGGGHAALRAVLDDGRRTMRARHRRHVPTGTLLNDRWQLARDHGFGEGASVYDECLILGDVVLGAHCWVGPFTVLDGSRGALRIGDHSQIGSGSHVYTHHSIEHCLTGGRAELFGAATTIGRCCFIAPMAVIGPGTVLGDHCFVASGSYVDGCFPSFSYLAGAPARRVGRVELAGDRARLILDAS